MKKLIIIPLYLSLPLFALFATPRPPSYMEWVDRAAQYIEDNKLDSASVALQSAMSLDPANENNPVLLLNLGILQRQLGLLDDAYISFTAAMGNNPMPGVVLHNRASLLCDLERFDEAMEDYDTLLRLFPDDLEAYYRRGLLFLEKGDRQKAEADFHASKAIDPGNIYTRLSQSLLFKLDDNWEAAAEVYSELIKAEPDPDPIFYLNRAECYLNTDRVSHALADLQVAESSQRNNPYFFILRGRARLEHFDKIAARGDFTRAKEMGYDEEIANSWLKRTE